MATMVGSYPVQFDVSYPERSSRWLLFFRPLLLLWLYLILFIPLIFFLLAFSLLAYAPFVAILNDGRYPRMFIKPVCWYLRLNARLAAYQVLLTDKFPFDDESSPVTLEIEVPDHISRLTTVFRLLLIIPHVIVLYLLGVVLLITTFIAWWAILFTGRYPRGLFDFAVGTHRWSHRVNVYSYFLTDKYPPFSLGA